jgi:hypothetical protein
MQCNAMQCNAMQCNAMQCNAMQCNAMQCKSMTEVVQSDFKLHRPGFRIAKNSAKAMLEQIMP